MTDNEFWEVIQTTLQAALNDSPLVPAPELAEAFQPRQQGAAENPIAFFNTISSRRYGWQKKKDVYNSDDDDFDTEESYILERVIQVSAMVYEDPSDLSKSTAFDIVDQIAGKLQTRPVRQSLLTSKIGILRITDIRTPYGKDESDRNVLTPNFDFTVNYRQAVTYKTPALVDIQPEFQAI